MNTKSLLLVFALLWASSMSLSSQTLVSINKSITQDTLLTTIQRNSISSKTVIASGQAVFSSKLGYVRILLSDDYGYDLLVYESSPLVAINGVDNFSSMAEETVGIPSHFALTKVRVEIRNAELRNLSVDVSTISPSRNQQQVKADRVALINSNLRSQNALWVAGETSVSQMSYEEKKSLFGGIVPDLQGFEYYVGGVFEIMEENGVRPDSMTTTSRATMVSKFDWRNRHGKNWNTSVKNQNPCNTCWVFGAIGAVEGLVNLYYNRKIDSLDLSEQQIISCAGSGCSGGGWSGDALNYIIASGVVNEACFPNGYASNPLCSNKCNNPTENIKIAGMQTFYPSSYSDPITELKKIIIQKGIIGGRIGAWSHAMTLVGFGTVQAGNVVYNGTSGGYNTPITIGVNDPRIGETYWIFKNSWGSSWGSDGGYLYAISDINQLTSSVIPLSPITSPNYTDANIVCEDRDGDGGGVKQTVSVKIF